MIDELQLSETAGQRVWLSGHIPPNNGACRVDWATVECPCQRICFLSVCIRVFVLIKKKRTCSDTCKLWIGTLPPSRVNFMATHIAVGVAMLCGVILILPLTEHVHTYVLTDEFAIGRDSLQRPNSVQ